MMNIKIAIYSIIALIVILSITIAMYYSNKFKNYQLSHKDAVIETQRNAIEDKNNLQDSFSKRVEALNKTQVIEKVIIREKIKQATNNKEEVYNTQFQSIISDMEQISGNESTN